MIFDRIDEDRVASEILKNGAHVGVQGIANRVGDDGFPVLGAEDQMHMEAGEGLGHGLGRPFRALDCLMASNLGRCPRLL